jgi:hypothetical protein
MSLLVALPQEASLIYDTFYAANSLFVDTFGAHEHSYEIELSFCIFYAPKL